MKILICFVICSFSITCLGQTKLISHRSHSGSNAHFHTAIEHHLFDIGHSNFGIVTIPERKIDSVILAANDKIIVLGKVNSMYKGTVLSTYFTRDTLTKINAGGFFKANSIDSLKSEIHKMYGAAAKSDSAIFIGFDRKFKQKKTPPVKQAGRR
jgi:hypothetical protein